MNKNKFVDPFAPEDLDEQLENLNAPLPPKPHPSSPPAAQRVRVVSKIAGPPSPAMKFVAAEELAKARAAVKFLQDDCGDKSATLKSFVLRGIELAYQEVVNTHGPVPQQYYNTRLPRGGKK